MPRGRSSASRSSRDYSLRLSLEPDTALATPLTAEPTTLTPVETTVPATLAAVETAVPATEMTAQPAQGSINSNMAKIFFIEVRRFVCEVRL